MTVASVLKVDFSDPKIFALIERMAKRCFPADKIETFHLESEWWIAYVHGWEDKKPAGFGAVRVVNQNAHLIAGGVLPEFRGLGLQRRLIRARVRWAKDHSVANHAVSFTLTDNPISSNNLITCGFRHWVPRGMNVKPNMIYWRKTL